MLADVRYLVKFVSKVKLLLLGLAMLANSLLGLATALIVQHAMQMQGVTSTTRIILFGLGCVALYAYVAVAILFGQAIENWLICDFSNNIVKKLMEQFMAHQTELTNSEKIAVLNLDMDLFESYYIAPIIDIPYEMVVFISPVIYMLTQNVWIGLLFLLGAFALLLPQFLFRKSFKKYGQRVSLQKAAFLDKATDLINGRGTLINNQSTQAALKRGGLAIESRTKAEFWSSMAVNLSFALVSFLRVFSEILPLIVGILMIAHGSNLKFSVLIALFSASQQIKQPLSNIVNDNSYLQQYVELKEKIFGLLKLPSQPSDEDCAAIEDFDKLVLSNLTKDFAHEKIFDGFSREILFGKKVLIKGESGSGKTTLLRLISGSMPKDAGEVYLVKGDKKYPLSPKDYGWVDQAPYLFNETIRYNLALGQDFQDEQLLQVLQEVNLSDLTLDFLVKNNGENISGGQKIRLEVARFLLRKKGLLLVDEVTAALDHENSLKIRELILSLPITVIEVAHHIDDESRYDEKITLEKKTVS